MRYSKERIFQSCNLNKHCLAAHLLSPILIEGECVDVIYILSLHVSDIEIKKLTYNIANSISTYNGDISVKCFFNHGNPLESIIVQLPLNSINEIESMEDK